MIQLIYIFFSIEVLEARKCKLHQAVVILFLLVRESFEFQQEQCTHKKLA